MACFLLHSLSTKRFAMPKLAQPDEVSKGEVYAFPPEASWAAGVTCRFHDAATRASRPSQQDR